MLVDTHLHLDRRDFAADRAEVLERAAAAGVTRFVNVGYDPESSVASVTLAESDPRIVATVGVHPHDADLIADPQGRCHAEGERVLARLAELVAHPRVVAVGEIGLDFYRDLSPRPAQRTALILQLDLASRCGKPVVFHVRDAYAETVAVLEAVGVPDAGGVLHAFAGDRETADWARRRGLKLGIGGPVTYKGSHLAEIVAACGLDDLVLETDAPWLPPVPHRGQRNEPAHLRLTAAKVAEISGQEPNEVARRTTENAVSLFGTLLANEPV